MDSTLHSQQAEQAVLRLTGQWRGAPPVTVVPSARDLPFAVPDDTRGAFLRGSGRAYIVANAQTLDLVPDTVAHEVLGHHAFHATLGQRWQSFMIGLQQGMRSGDWRLQCFRDHVRSIYVGADGSCNLRPVQESDEVVAAIVESRFSHESLRMEIQDPVRKRALAIAGQIARERLYLDRPVTFQELEGMILEAEHRLRHGGPLWGLGFRLKQWYGASMGKPMGAKNPPRSLAESERLLKSEAMRLQGLEDWRAMWILLSGISALLALIALIGWCGLLIADLIGKLAYFLS